MWRDLFLGYVVVVLGLCLCGAAFGEPKRLLQRRKRAAKHVSNQLGVAVSRGHRTIQ